MPDRADGKYVSQSDALALWWPAAREVLLETARGAGRITEQELAARVQAVTGVSTRQPSSEWIGRVLERVAIDTQSRGEPPLVSLCVRQQAAPDRRRASTSAAKSTARASQASTRTAPRPAIREVTCQECWMLVPAAPRCRNCDAPLNLADDQQG